MYQSVYYYKKKVLLFIHDFNKYLLYRFGQSKRQKVISAFFLHLTLPNNLSNEVVEYLRFEGRREKIRREGSKEIKEGRFGKGLKRVHSFLRENFTSNP